MARPDVCKRACTLFLICGATAIASPAQPTFTTLASFDWSNGASPALMSLVQGLDGDFYGTTYWGGAYGYGTIFKIARSGELTTLYNFCAQSNCPDGAGPVAGLVLGTDGNFYGTTSYGGAHDSGTVFKIAPGGTLTTLYAFCAQAKCSDGAYSEAGLVQATSGNFYGTTAGGGTSGYGTVFKITPSGTLTTLHSFCAQTNCTDGAYPRAELVQATDGNFYGTTYSGGTSGNCNAPPGCGTAFRVTVGLGPFVEALPYSGKVGATIDFLREGLAATTGVSFSGTAASFTVKSETYLTATVPSGAATGYVTVATPGGLLKSNKKFRVTQ